MKTVCVIPAYRARDTIGTVVTGALAFASTVIVVDDACPEGSAEVVEREFGTVASVVVIRRPTNGGVGAATKTGIGRALELGADVIVKIDADDQMDASRIPEMVAVIAAHSDVAMVKGNRFVDASVLQVMPKARFFGNAVLSILAKFASGYWSMLDPTNGFIAFNTRILRTVNWVAFADAYFFELSVLCALGLRRERIAEIEMTAIYGSAPSSLSIRRVVLTFPPLLLRAFARRVLTQYFLLDFNAGSLCLIVGFVLAIIGGLTGAFQWSQSVSTGIARPTGTIMMIALTLMSGFQLLFASLLYDVLLGPRLLRVAPQYPAQVQSSRGGQVRAAAHPTGEKRSDVSAARRGRIALSQLRSSIRTNATALGIAFGALAWFAFVAARMYGLTPTAQEIVPTQLQQQLLVFSGVPRNVESLVLTCSFAVSAIFPGYLLTALARVKWSSLMERLVFAVTFGLMFYTVAFLALGGTGLLKPIPLFALTAVCLVGTLLILLRERRRSSVDPAPAYSRASFVAALKKSKVEVLLGAVLAYFVFMGLLAGLNYELRFDASWYHLAEARRWAIDGRIDNLLARNRSLTAGLQHYREVLYAGIIPMFGLIAAKLVAWIDLVLALLAMVVFGTRYIKSRAMTMLACVIFACTPIVLYSAGTASNDLPLAAITVLAAYALLRWNEDRTSLGWLALAGALAGYSTGVKTTGIFTALVCSVLVGALAVIHFYSRPDATARKASVKASVFGGLAFLVGAATFALPGLVQSAQWTRDPIFPLFPGLFKSPYDISYLVPPGWYSSYLHNLPAHIGYLLSFPWLLTIDNNTVVGPIFLVMTPLVAVALIMSRRRRTIMLFLLAFCTLWAAVFNLTPTLLFRYAEGIAPFLAFLAAYPLFVFDERSRPWRAARASVGLILALMIAFNIPPLVSLQVKAVVPGDEGASNYDWNYLYRNWPVPSGAPAPPPLAKTVEFMNSHLPIAARVYDDAELFPYTLWINPQLFMPSPDARAWTLQSPDAFEQLRRNHVDYIVSNVRKLQTLKRTSLGTHLRAVWATPPSVTPSVDSAIVLTRIE
jgi:hypothetical protein